MIIPPFLFRPPDDMPIEDWQDAVCFIVGILIGLVLFLLFVACAMHELD